MVSAVLERELTINVCFEEQVGSNMQGLYPTCHIQCNQKLNLSITMNVIISYLFDDPSSDDKARTPPWLET